MRVCKVTIIGNCRCVILHFDAELERTRIHSTYSTYCMHASPVHFAHFLCHYFEPTQRVMITHISEKPVSLMGNHNSSPTATPTCEGQC